jgi:NAD(P)-dependent dehydrogenase (short-subunit alcohol dehydrogenase family)
MKDLRGKVAVVTGGGSGIGAGLCRAFAGAGMKVVAADIDEMAAERTAEELRRSGARAMAVRTDVADPDSVDRLAETATAEMGAVHLVCNNAAVLVGGPLAKMTEDDWRWLLSVNLMGVVHGCRTFAPHLVAQGEGHIVNTASVGGFLAYSEMAVYCTTKFAIVGFSEALRQDLEPHGIGVSILCPGKVATKLGDADRLRPASFARAGGTSKVLDDLAEGGMDPLEVGEHVLRGVENDAPYIFTHPEYREPFASRFAKILAAFGRRS